MNKAAVKIDISLALLKIREKHKINNIELLSALFEIVLLEINSIKLVNYQQLILENLIKSFLGLLDSNKKT